MAGSAGGQLAQVRCWWGRRWSSWESRRQVAVRLLQVRRKPGEGCCEWGECRFLASEILTQNSSIKPPPLLLLCKKLFRKLYGQGDHWCDVANHLKIRNLYDRNNRSKPGVETENIPAFQLFSLVAEEYFLSTATGYFFPEPMTLTMRESTSWS